MTFIKAISQCNNTSSVTITPTSNGASITWAAVSGAVQYSARIFSHPANVDQGIFTVQSGTSWTFIGLAPNTQYRFQIATICASSVSTGTSSIFSTTSGIVACTPMTAACYSYKYLKVDSMLHVSAGDTSLLRADRRGGAIVFKNSDSSYYGWNGLKWRNLGSASSNVTPFVDTIFLNGDTLKYKKNNVIYGITNIGNFDTTSMNNRINLKLNISDTSSMLNAYKHWQYNYTSKNYVDSGLSTKANFFTASAPLFRSGALLGINNADPTTTGALTSTDWNRFNNKWDLTDYSVDYFDDAIIGSNQVNGINNTFSLRSKPKLQNIFVFKNGKYLTRNNDYKIFSDSILQFVQVPLKKDSIRAIYLPSNTVSDLSSRFDSSNTNNIVFYGNSLFEGTGAIKGFTDVCSQSFNFFPTVGFRLSNQSLAGVTTRRLTDSINNRLRPQIRSSYKTNVVLVTEILNDMSTGQTVTQAYNNYKTLHNSIKAIGGFVKTVAFTVTPATTFFLTGSQRNQINDSIRLNYKQFADTLVDVALNVNIGISGANANSNYYRSDSTHMWHEGYFQFARAIYPVVINYCGITPQNVTQVFIPSNNNFVANASILSSTSLVLGGGNMSDTSQSQMIIGSARKIPVRITSNSKESILIDSSNTVNIAPDITTFGTGTNNGVIISPTLRGSNSGSQYDAVTIGGRFLNVNIPTTNYNILKVKGQASTDSIFTIPSHKTGTESLFDVKFYDTKLSVNSLKINGDLNTSNFRNGAILFNNENGTVNSPLIGVLSSNLIYNTTNNFSHSFRTFNTERFSVGNNGAAANTFTLNGDFDNGVGYFMTSTGRTTINAMGIGRKSGRFTFNIPNASGYTFEIQNTRVVDISSDGNLLVGTTTNSGFKADINGTCRVTGVLTLGTITIRTGTGSPEGFVTATVGSQFMRTDGGANTTLYVKESGTGNTGWVAK